MFVGAIRWLNRESGENPEPARGCKRQFKASKPLFARSEWEGEKCIKTQVRRPAYKVTSLSFSRREKTQHETI